MTSTPPERPCAAFHREQHLLRSPFTNPEFLGGPGERHITAQIQRCSYRGAKGPALLRLTVHTSDGETFIDLPTYISDDLFRRARALTTVAEDLDGLDGYHASQYKEYTGECEC